MHRTRLTVIVLGVIAVCLCRSSITTAQEAAGTIEGTVVDATGAVLPNATVTVKGQVTRAERTGPVGTFHVPDLPPGSYAVTASHPRFAPQEKTDIVVKAGETSKLTLKLDVAIGVTLVVTATRNEELSIQDAPVSISVIQSDAIASSPGQNFGDLLRSVPGLNVVQTSAREINLASRQSAPLLTNSQIALIDGRTVYSDFFNIIFWDLIPTNVGDIKQVEVVRGPASAMWGANAATGVVNIITKPPREAPGVNLTLTGGGFSRVNQDAGGLFGVNASYSHVPNEKWAYRMSAGYFSADPYSRPTGQVPISTSPIDPTIVVGGGSYDATAFSNRGTHQPKLDLRVDRDFTDGGHLSYSGGMASSSGIIHTPIGPFDLQRGNYLGYSRISYDRGAFRVSGFANLLSGQAPNLIERDAMGNPLRIDFNTDTYDVDGGYSQLVAGRHMLSYGGNLRRNTFDISITPSAKDRTEVGAYVQDDISFGRARVALSARIDKFDNVVNPLFAPRAAFIYKVASQQSVRFSFNRAYRAPSAIDNYLDITVIGGVLPLDQILPILPPDVPAQFPFPTRTVGNPDLKAESLNAYEVAYSGMFGRRTTAEVAFYINQSDNVISSAASAQNPELLGYNPYYTSQNPPPGWPLPPFVLDLLANAGIYLPAVVKTLNLGGLRNRGLEFSINHSFNSWLNGYANYSFQDKPKQREEAGDLLRVPSVSIGVAPPNRYNAGITINRSRYLGVVAVNHADKAFWTDVLSEQYYGYSRGYTMVDATFGIRWADGKITTSVKAVNIANQEIQQHNFGDVLKRSVIAEVRFGR